MTKTTKIVLVLLGVVLAVELSFLLLAPVLHRVRGGDALPSPDWTEVDLLPIPEGKGNAWDLIGPLAELPPFNVDRKLLGSELIPPADIAAVDVAVSQPSVAALLHKADLIRMASFLASPSATLDYSAGDMLRVVDWHDWVFLSVKRKIATEPARAARELSQLIPLWTRCANMARHDLFYAVCAIQARRDLELAQQLAHELADDDARAELENSIRESPAPSPKNVLVAAYVRAHTGMQSYQVHGKKRWLRWTDLRQTWEDIEDTLDSVFEGKPCDERDLSSFGYNWGGKLFATVLTAGICASAPQLVATTQKVAKRRQEALTALSGGT